MEWKREVVNEPDFSYSIYTASVGEKRGEIRVLDGGTGDNKYGGNLLLEKMVSKKPERWDAVVDRVWFPTYAQAQKIAEAWLNQ